MLRCDEATSAPVSSSRRQSDEFVAGLGVDVGVALGWPESSGFRSQGFEVDLLTEGLGLGKRQGRAPDDTVEVLEELAMAQVGSRSIFVPERCKVRRLDAFDDACADQFTVTKGCDTQLAN